MIAFDVLEDVEMNRKMLKMLLGKEGVASEMAENGQIALDMVLSDVDKYSILLMDNQMPVMVGGQHYDSVASLLL